MKCLVVGCGSIGKRHLRLLNERADVILAACDVDQAAHKAVDDVSSDIRFFISLDAALAWKPDLVVVANPNAQHADTTLRSLAAGAHVLCEKPIADTVANGRKMVVASRKYRKVLAVGYSERFRPSLQHIVKMVRHGELGNLIGGRAMVGTYNTLLCARTNCRDMFGTLLVDYTHEFDYLGSIFGDVKAVACFANRLGKKKFLAVNPTTAVTVLRYASDALVSVHMDYVQHPPRRSLEVYGDRKTLELDLMTNILRIFDTDKEGFLPLTFETNRDNQFRAEHQDMIDAVRKGKRPCVTGEVGLQVLEIAEKAIRQIARGSNKEDAVVRS
jgi:predicted dehydrogenase